MSNCSTFMGPRGLVRVALPFQLEEQIVGWGDLRKAMLKEVPAEFTRDEWAYLTGFVDIENLRNLFQETFGAQTDEQASPALVATPRGPIGLWLPNNVSLLGVLMLIVVSLTGNRLRMKAGSHSRDLTGAFLEFSREHANKGPLSSYLRDSVHHDVFSWEDPRNVEMSQSSAVRIVFGSDESVSAIHALPHPVESLGISFSNRRSEAWLDVDKCDDKTLRDLIKIFAIYGQTGCTSPSRVILLNATLGNAVEMRDRLVALWPSVIRRRPEMNVTSDNVRAWQLACATGWDSVLIGENRGVVSVGDYALPNLSSGFMELRIIAATLEEACANLPKNIQTIGHVLKDASSQRALDLLAGANVARFVPLAAMHNFETIWDGQDFFAQLFTYMRVRA